MKWTWIQDIQVGQGNTLESAALTALNDSGRSELAIVQVEFPTVRKKSYVTVSGTGKGLNLSQVHRRFHPDVMEVYKTQN